MKKLYRSKTDQMVAGVCGGLGEYFNIDSTLIRVILVIGVVFSAFSLLAAYIIAMLIIPRESEVQ